MNRETTPPLDVLMAASLYLMTRYAEEQPRDGGGAGPSTSSGSASTRNALSWPGRPHTSRRDVTISRA
jgi:hypothetical protein